MRKTPFVITGIFAAVCVIVVPFIALSAAGSEDAAIVDVASRDQAAKELFATNCGSCHALVAGGTDGVVGPDLDELLAPTGTGDAEAYDGLYSRVLNAITCGRGGRMPRGIVAGEEAQDVAQFVAAYAGQIGDGPTVDTADASTGPPGPC